MNKNCVLLILMYALCTKAQTDTLQTFDDTTSSHLNIPLFNTGGDDGESSAEQQDVSSLLQSSRDVFAQFAGFQFGAARYKMRGATARNTQVSINGIPVNSPETGAATWSSWGGLNDVTRYAETRIGIAASRYSFSGISGYVNMDIAASSLKKGIKVSYASSNRFYRHRFMLTYATGMTEKGWAFSSSLSYRRGQDLLFNGTYFNAGAVYLSADKKINKKHLLSLATFVAPIEQGRTSSSTLEAYRLSGTNFYNSNWGYQAGKERNAAISRNYKPTVVLTHLHTPNETKRLNTSLYFSKGKSSISGLTWYDAPNPDPDYYRYLPSYYYQNGDSTSGDKLSASWENDPSRSQIKWDNLIGMNQANLYTAPHLLGQGSNTTETRARYILERRVENTSQLTLNCVYNKRKKDNFISAGFNGGLYQNRKYKEVEDLLGASYWLDVDQFAEGLGTEDFIIQNDLDNPNKKIKVGDRFGYDYSIFIRKIEAWAQIEHSGKRLEYFLSFSTSASSIWREGYVANGKFPTTSKGKSDVISFLNYGIKGGTTYKLSGRHFMTLNTFVGTRPTETSALFISPRVRNDHLQNPTNEKIFSADISYHVKFPALKTRVTLFYSQVNDQSWVRSYWHDSYNTNVNLIMQNVDQKYQGIEFGFEKILHVSHVVQAAFSAGQFIYSNRPTLQAWQDNNSAPLYDERTAYLKNYFIGGTPQTVLGLTYRYNARKYWFACITGNYLADLYIEPNPDRRTEEAVGKFYASEKDLAAEIIDQEKLPNFFILNANGGKSFNIKRKYRLNINFSANNLLNQKNTRISGFESLRWDPVNISKFPNKYTYMGGTSYLLLISLNF